MIPRYLKNQIRKDDLEFKDKNMNFFLLPNFNPRTHYLDLTKGGYFQALIVLRHYIEIMSDYYFGTEIGAKKIDLFMFTTSVSSPMGPGSDSEALPFKFGKYNSNLVDSSQFGFEPLLVNGIKKVYCYLPSMRGEKPDKRHLNQFFHCEAEIIGNLEQLMPIIEKYIKTLAETLLLMTNILNGLSVDCGVSVLTLNKVIKLKQFPRITFDEAVNALVDNGYKNLVNFTDFGQDILSEGELMLAKIFNFDCPFWITNYFRDRVPFYQKPDPKNPNKAINADLIFPALIPNSFGGEIVGCGQRQDSVEEIIDSLCRQGISSKPYEWYINLRSLSGYKTTSGFGLGIERFITWCLCRDDIKDSILYPRLKDIESCP